MLPRNEAHGNNLEDHFAGVDDKEDLIDDINVLCDEVDLFISGEDDTVDHDYEENELVEQRIDRHDLDNLVSERVGHRKTA